MRIKGDGLIIVGNGIGQVPQSFVGIAPAKIGFSVVGIEDNSLGTVSKGTI